LVAKSVAKLAAKLVVKRKAKRMNDLLAIIKDAAEKRVAVGNFINFRI
jgi:hypothetical protein